MHDGNDLPSDDHDCYVCSRDVDLVERCELISDRSMPRPKLEIAPESVGLVPMVMNASIKHTNREACQDGLDWCTVLCDRGSDTPSTNVSLSPNLHRLCSEISYWKVTRNT